MSTCGQMVDMTRSLEEIQLDEAMVLQQVVGSGILATQTLDHRTQLAPTSTCKCGKTHHQQVLDSGIFMITAANIVLFAAIQLKRTRTLSRDISHEKPS